MLGIDRVDKASMWWKTFSVAFVSLLIAAWSLKSRAAKRSQSGFALVDCLVLFALGAISVGLLFVAVTPFTKI